MTSAGMVNLTPSSPLSINVKGKDLRVYVIGACYLDIVLHVDSYPREDSKVRAQRVEKRRGGNGANLLSVLSQFSEVPSPTLGSVHCELVCVFAGDKPNDSIPDEDQAAVMSSPILQDLRSNASISLKHCVFRGVGYSEPTAWIIAVTPNSGPSDPSSAIAPSLPGHLDRLELSANTPSVPETPNSPVTPLKAHPHTGLGSRTVINHTTVPELSGAEFMSIVLAPLRAKLETINTPSEVEAAESLWFHFEGRNVSEVEKMVDALILLRKESVERAERCGVSGAWKSVDGDKRSGLGIVDAATPVFGLSALRKNSLNTATGSLIPPSTSRSSSISSAAGSQTSPLMSFEPSTPSKPSNPPETSVSSPILPNFTISVEFEKTNRPGLDNLLPKADVLLFSQVYAEGKGFPDAPTGFLDNIRRQCKPGAILFVTWGHQGAFGLINDPTRPARTFHAPAIPIYPIDTIGAGDTFAAGCVHALGLRGLDAQSAAIWACRLATAKCAQLGFDGLAQRITF